MALLWCALVVLAWGSSGDDLTVVCERAAEIVADCVVSVAGPGRVPSSQLPSGCGGSLTVCDAECFLRDPEGACDSIVRPEVPGDRGEVVAACLAACR
ncbi:MAG: hypothetical protein WBG86_06370 [Polyangiales bacterium]